MNDTPKHRVASVERALSILEVFNQERPSLLLGEIAALTGLYPSTVSRISSSLVHWGYLRRGSTGEYHLGPATLRLGAVYQESFNLGDVVRPVLAELSLSSGESAAFYTRQGNERVCLYRHHSHHSMRHHLLEGARLPLDLGASGHVLSAYTGENQAVHIATRRDGFRVSRGERTVESYAVAVPVWDRANQFIGAIAIVGPSTRVTEGAIPGLIELLQNSAETIRKQVSVKVNNG